MSLSPHTIRRRHAAASSCTSCVPHGRTTGPTSPGTALLCYSDVFCVCFVRPSAQGRLLLRVLRAFRLLRCVKLFYQLARILTTTMSINEQSLGRSPPKMRATERGVTRAICVSIYDTRCIHSTPPRAFSSNRRHLPARAPSRVCARAAGGAPAQSSPILSSK